MAEGLLLPDGKPVPAAPPASAADVDRQFAEAMAAPPDEVPAPPKREIIPEPEEKPKPRRRGRPPKSERTRVTKTPEPPSDKDYTEDVTGIVTGAWLTLASIGKTQPYAAVIANHQDGLVTALSAGAKNNATIRGYIEKMSSGGGGLWAVQLALVAAQMAMEASQIAKNPELKAQAAEMTKQQLAEVLGKAREADAQDESQRVF